MASIETEMTVTLRWDDLDDLTDWMRHIEAALAEIQPGSGMRYAAGRAGGNRRVQNPG